jgi:ArpU family phage transcriptional regulator
VGKDENVIDFTEKLEKKRKEQYNEIKHQVVKILKNYQKYKTRIEEAEKFLDEKYQEISSIDFTQPSGGKTNSKPQPVENFVVNKEEKKQKIQQLKKYCQKIKSALEKLSKKQRKILVKKYVNPQYMRSDDWNVSMEIGMTRNRKYYRIKKEAFVNFATTMGLFDI